MVFTGTDAAGQEGVFIDRSLGQSFTRVLGTSDSLDGRAVTDLSIGRYAVRGYLHDPVYVESDSSVAFWAALSDGTQGVYLATGAGNEILGNRIGTDASGLAPLGNAGPGIRIVDAENNVIGGTASGEANQIAFNGGAGVSVEGIDARRNTLRGNVIYSNNGLGIDLADDGPSPNDPYDADEGPNGLQNYPTLVAGQWNAATQVTGTLHSLPDTTYTIDIYAVSEPGPTGVSTGPRWIRETTVRTDANGDAAFDVLLPATSEPLEYLVATATSEHGDTSEFSPPALPTPETLVVTSLQPAPSGFVVRFNHIIDPATLSLYDVESDVYGEPDVVLVGDTVGSVPGSLIIDSRGVTFVATSGALAADAYTVRLRGATDGFRHSATGTPLDGDADGTPGGEYAGPFTVAASDAIVLNLPDFARGPGQSVDVPATQSGLPLRVSNGAGIQSLDLTIRYNAALLEITGAALGTGVPSDATVLVLPSPPGELRLNFVSTTPLHSGPVDFLTLTARVSDGAAYGTAHVLDLSEVVVNLGQLPATADDAIHTVAYFGDTTGDKTYSGLDAQRIARVVVQLDSGFEAFPCVDPKVIADIDANGGLTGLDAVLVAREVV